MDKVKISRKGFKCAYCDKFRKGAYKIVDGMRSCESCNRAYDYHAPEIRILCKVCNGKGYFTNFPSCSG
jgi:hypothetical protein